jgi:hypothetical protein
MNAHIISVRLNEKEINKFPEFTNEIFEISVITPTEADMDEFVSFITKRQAKNRSHVTTFTYPEDGGIVSHNYPYIVCRKMAINKVTGAANEFGDKNIERFYQGVKNYIESKNK